MTLLTDVQADSYGKGPIAPLKSSRSTEPVAPADGGTIPTQWKASLLCIPPPGLHWEKKKKCDQFVKLRLCRNTAKVLTLLTRPITPHK